MVMTSENAIGDHDTHAKGLAALMKIGHMPLNLLGSMHSTLVSNFSKTRKVRNNSNSGLSEVNVAFRSLAYSPSQP